MGGKNQKTTQTTKMEPWKAAQPGLQLGINDAMSLYQNGGFAADPYQGNRVAGFGDVTQQGMNSILNQAAGGTPGTDAAIGSLQGMLSGQNQYGDLQGVRDNILSSAIPAAVSQFAGSGMSGSSVAQQGVGGAAASALAPFEYDAYNQQQNRALQAAGMMPGLERAQYLPGQMMQQVGSAQDLMAQNRIDADMARYYETQNQPLNNLNGYLNAMMGLGGMGGTNSATGQAPGGGGIGAGIAGGLGTYGALAANPATAPFAILGGLGAGLAGLF